jgi:hypothetical protein
VLSEHHVIQYYSKNRGKTPGIPILHGRSRYVVNFTFRPPYPRHILDRNVRIHFDRTGICGQDKIPSSTEYRTPVARTGTATSLSKLPAFYHNLRLSVKSKNLNYVVTRTINLFLHLVIRLPCDTVSKIFIVKQSRGIYSFLGTASSTFTDRNSDVCGIYKQ